MVVDADIGLANLDLLCGLTPRYDLGDVLAGRCRLVDALVMGRARSRSCPGRTRSGHRPSDLGDAPARLVAELSELEAESDFVLVDAGSGLGPACSCWPRRPNRRSIVSTPEPTSIADAHAAIGRFRPADRPASAAGARQSSRLDLGSRRRAGPAGRLEPPVPGGGGFTAGDRFDPGRPACAPGGPRPQAVLDRLSGIGRLARGPTPGPRSGQGAPAAIRERGAGFFTALAARWAFASVASGERSIGLRRSTA